MVFGNAANPDEENSLASVFSTVPEEAFCMMGIAGNIPSGPGESSSAEEAFEEPNCDRWKESMAEELKDLWEEATFREG